MKVIELKNITKNYRHFKALDQVSLSVERGHIVGLIGPNGAGKTTIMKIIGGLSHPTDGELKLFDSSENIEKSRQRLSFMIENPFIDGALTARENMEYARFLLGVADKSRCETLLKYVKLGDTGRKAARHFSLGMRQRLGIAIALLPDPEVLVLDEPVNGLDPEGIVEIRNILRELCEKDGKTIIISSHLLSELSELCTDYILIDQGRIVESLSREELMEHSRSYLAIRTDHTPETLILLEQRFSASDYRVLKNGEIRMYNRSDDPAAISRAITGSGHTILHFAENSDSLEDYYLSRVSHDKPKDTSYSAISNLFGGKRK